MQVDTRERGFSYAYDAPLDMRMDPDAGASPPPRSSTPGSRAGSSRLLRDYGEERYADRIAEGDRPPPRRGDLTTTFELVDAITAAIPAPARFAGGHPAKRTFQAIRIAVNDELAPARRGAPARVGPAARRRPARRDLVPLAGGPARQALPRRPHPRLHLPARPARLRLRPDAAGRARVPPLGRADARRGRRQPPLEVRPPAGRPQADRRGGARMTPAPARTRRRTHARTARRPRPRRVSGPVTPPHGRGARRRPPRCRAGAARRACSRASARCPSTASSTACCAAAPGSGRSARCSAGSSRCRCRCSSSTPASRARSRRRRRSSARTPGWRRRSRGCRGPTGSRPAPRARAC